MAQYGIDQRYHGSGVTMPGIAGETVPRGAAVYMSAVDGLWYLADSDAAATMPAVGIVSDAGDAGNVIQIHVLGLIERSDWTWTRGDPLYISGTAGVLTQTAPATNTQAIGVAMTATMIYVDVKNAAGIGSATGCALLEGATAYVGFDDCKEPFTNYFLCDGTADDVQIQAGIDYVNGLGGGTILLEDGTYDITAVITLYNDLFIEGSGEETLLQLANGVNDSVFYASQKNNIIIKYLKIDGNKANQAETGSADMVENGIHLIRCNDCLIDNVHVIDTLMHAIIIRGGTAVDETALRNTVSNCLVENIGLSGLTYVGQGGILVFSYAHDTIVENNRIIAPAASQPTNAKGIYHSFRCDRTIIKNNYMSGFDTANAFGISSISFDCLNTLIDGNTIENCTGNHCISVESDNASFPKIGVTIVNNQIDCDGLAIGGIRLNNYVEDAIISNNVVKVGAGNAIVLWENIINSIVTENHVSASNGQIYLAVSTCQNNLIKDNTFVGAGRFIIDDGTDTLLASKPFQFTEAVNGAIVTASPTGVDVDATTEAALAWGQLPEDLQFVVRLKIWAVATDAPIGAGGQMHLEVTFNAGASNAAYNTANKSWNITNFDGEEADYVADDVVHWVIERGDVGNELDNLAAGDSFEIFAIWETGADPDGATDALFRVVEVEYV